MIIPKLTLIPTPRVHFSQSRSLALVINSFYVVWNIFIILTVQYDRQLHIRILDEAEDSGLTAVDRKNNWEVICY